MRDHLLSSLTGLGRVLSLLQVGGGRPKRTTCKGGEVTGGAAVGELLAG